MSHRKALPWQDGDEEVEAATADLDWEDDLPWEEDDN